MWYFYSSLHQNCSRTSETWQSFYISNKSWGLFSLRPSPYLWHVSDFTHPRSLHCIYVTFLSPPPPPACITPPWLSKALYPPVSPPSAFIHTLIICLWLMGCSSLADYLSLVLKARANFVRSYKVLHRQITFFCCFWYCFSWNYIIWLTNVRSKP